MYALMAKCEELNRTMRPVYRIQDQMYPLLGLCNAIQCNVLFFFYETDLTKQLFLLLIEILTHASCMITSKLTFCVTNS